MKAFKTLIAFALASAATVAGLATTTSTASAATGAVGNDVITDVHAGSIVDVNVWSHDSAGDSSFVNDGFTMKNNYNYSGTIVGEPDVLWTYLGNGVVRIQVDSDAPMGYPLPITYTQKLADGSSISGALNINTLPAVANHVTANDDVVNVPTSGSSFFAKANLLSNDLNVPAGAQISLIDPNGGTATSFDRLDVDYSVTPDGEFTVSGASSDLLYLVDGLNYQIKTSDDQYTRGHITLNKVSGVSTSPVTVPTTPVVTAPVTTAPVIVKPTTPAVTPTTSTVVPTAPSTSAPVVTTPVKPSAPVSTTTTPAAPTSTPAPVTTTKPSVPVTTAPTTSAPVAVSTAPAAPVTTAPTTKPVVSAPVTATPISTSPVTTPSTPSTTKPVAPSTPIVPSTSTTPSKPSQPVVVIPSKPVVTTTPAAPVTSTTKPSAPISTTTPVAPVIPSASSTVTTKPVSTSSTSSAPVVTKPSAPVTSATMTPVASTTSAQPVVTTKPVHTKPSASTSESSTSTTKAAVPVASSSAPAMGPKISTDYVNGSNDLTRDLGDAGIAATLAGISIIGARKLRK